MLRKIPLRRVGNRHHLFLGGDREMTMMLALLCGTLIFVALDLRATLLGVAMWFVGLRLLRMMGSADPLMRGVYMRNRRYARYYPARSTPYRENTPSQERQYQ